MTPSSAAQPVAAAIDYEDWPEVVGTIAGDDTELIICPDERQARLIKARIEDYIGLGRRRRTQQQPEGIGGTCRLLERNTRFLRRRARTRRGRQCGQRWRVWVATPAASWHGCCWLIQSWLIRSRCSWVALRMMLKAAVSR